MIEDTHDYDPYANLQYRCIRFKNGDLIIAGVPEDDLDFTSHALIEVYTPVQLIEVTYVDEDGNPSQAYTMRQWMPMSDDEYFSILDRLHVESLKEILAEEKSLTEEEREEIEQQIEATGMIPGEIEEEEIPTTKYLH